MSRTYLCDSHWLRGSFWSTFLAGSEGHEAGAVVYETGPEGYGAGPEGYETNSHKIKARCSQKYTKCVKTCVKINNLGSRWSS